VIDEGYIFKCPSVILTIVSMTDETESGIWISIPLPEERVFRNQAIEDILLLLTRNPSEEFTVSQLREITDHGGDTVATALDILEAINLIQTQRNGRKKLIRANQERIHNPDDKIAQIPQKQFRTPIKAFLSELEEQDIEAIGVILFGSVARGEADRASDIDILIIVEDNAVKARREAQEVRQAVESQKFDGDRYEFQVMVETVDSTKNYGSKLHEIFSEGIVLDDLRTLGDVKQGVFSGQ
jgi:predicted nucleotidyltransferase